MVDPHLSGRFLFQGLTVPPMVDPHLSGRFLFQGSTDQRLILTLLEGFMVDPHLSGRFVFQGSTVPPMVDPHVLEGFFFKALQSHQWLTLTFLEGLFSRLYSPTNG